MADEKKPWDTVENPAAAKLRERTAAWKKRQAEEEDKKKKKPLPEVPKMKPKMDASTAQGATQRQKHWAEKIDEYQKTWGGKKK